MKHILFSAILASAIAIIPAGAQSYRQTATLTSNAESDSGRCSVEVVVPGAAQVRIRGDSASLVKLSGRSPEWRKFECTGPMPRKPTEFRMETMSGRGMQDLVHGPHGHSGTAVVYIDDPGHGEDTYSFDIIWGNPPSTMATR